jgi:hypothetical protein
MQSMGKPSDYNHGGSSDISSNKKAKPNTTVDLTHSLDLIVVLETDDSVSTQHEPNGFLNISDDETKQPIGTNANKTPYATTFDGAKEMAHNKDENKGDTDFVQLVATEALEGILTQESPAGIPPLQDPPSILKRKKKKQSMLQAASSGTKSGVNPFFASGKTNKEVIPVEDFKNTVFLKLTITVPSKLVGFPGTALKWALQQFMEWFEQVREDLGDNISLILLSYSMSS